MTSSYRHGTKNRLPRIAHQLSGGKSASRIQVTTRISKTFTSPGSRVAWPEPGQASARVISTQHRPMIAASRAPTSVAITIAPLEKRGRFRLRKSRYREYFFILKPGLQAKVL